MINIERSIVAFEEMKTQELKPRTRKEYIYALKRFAEFINLRNKSKRDLRDRGRKYILDYLRQGVPKKSWRKVRAGLQVFWEDIFELEWPVRRSDIKINFKAGRGQTPSDNLILEWAKALEHEQDPYLRLVWLMIIQHGWRPSHIGGIRWKHIQRDSDGIPVAIIVHPKNEEFKTDQPIAARLASDIIKALKEWENETKELGGKVRSEDLVLPWRSRAQNARCHWERPYDFHQGLKVWDDLRERYRLPKLTPRECRHWVSTACRKVGLSKAATAYLQGHDSSNGSTMRDWYDNPSEQDAIAEQAQIIPNGPLGTLIQPENRIKGEVPNEAKDLINRFLKGDLGSIDMMFGMESLKNRLTGTNMQKP